MTIPAGQTVGDLRRRPDRRPNVYEGKETVVATLTAASTNGVALARLRRARLVGRHRHHRRRSHDRHSDKPIIGITVNPAIVDEDGATNLTYTVAIANGKTSDFTTIVTFTLGGTATEGTDYATP